MVLRTLVSIMHLVPLDSIASNIMLVYNLIGHLVSQDGAITNFFKIILEHIYKSRNAVYSLLLCNAFSPPRSYASVYDLPVLFKIL